MFAGAMGGAALGGLERRVAAAEAALGRGGGGGGGEEGRSLGEQVAEVRAAVAMLQEGQMAANTEKMRQLVELSKRVPEGNQQQPDAETIRRLLAAVRRWDGALEGLPRLVARLKSLREVHEEAAALGESVAAIRAEQAALRQMLASGSELLASVQKGVEENQAAVAKNAEALLSRLEKATTTTK